MSIISINVNKLNSTVALDGVKNLAYVVYKGHIPKIK